MNEVDRLLARAQVGLATFCALGIFGLVFVLLLHHTDLNSTIVTIITSIISVLATVFTLQQNFFFARIRPPALPDPTTTTSTVTTTTTPIAVAIPAATIPSTVTTTATTPPLVATPPEKPK